MIIFPEPNEVDSHFLRRRGGGRVMLLLNVNVDGQLTSVCENTLKSGSWRTRHDKSGKGHLNDHGGIAVLPETISLSCNDATEIAEALPVISDALIQHCGRAIPIGTIQRGSPLMLTALAALESCATDIRNSVRIDLTTDMFQLRRSLQKREVLIEQGHVSSFGKRLLGAFRSSQTFYAGLPELREFVGTERVTGDPSDKGGKIRKWIDGLQLLDLPSGERLSYIQYELKPLRVSGLLGWTCQVAENDRANPRRDSVDVLMCYDTSPVFVEIKAAGDSFCSAALAQILYYGCILSNERQRRRLNRQFPSVAKRPGWICVIAQERDKQREPGFEADEQKTVAFLRHSETKEALAPYFRGALVIVVKMKSEGVFSVTRSTTVAFGTPDNPTICGADVDAGQ